MQAGPSEKQSAILKSDSIFPFRCDGSLLCFTQCCRNVNIYLTPYDVLRLRRSLKIGSAEFLDRYTLPLMARGTNIPAVQLLMSPETLYCRLVTEEGCTVYEDRPWACRMYPLDLTPQEGEYRPLVGKDRCFGFLEPGSWTVGEWLSNQGIEPFLEMDKLFQSVLPERFRPGGPPMDPGEGKLFFLAYDLDRFAELLRDEDFRKFSQVDEALFEKVMDHDEELLKLAFRFIRSQLEEA